MSLSWALPGTQQREFTNAERAVLIALFTLATALFAFIFWKGFVLQATSDLHIHIDYARKIHSLRDLESPHFLFQLLIIGVAAVLPITLEAAAVLVLGACYGVMAVVVARELGRQQPALSIGSCAGLAVAVLVATHIFLPTLFVPNFYYGYFNVTAYHNPTQQLNKLFALLIWFAYSRYVVAETSLRPQVLTTLAALCLLSAIAKPSFLIAFLPLAGVVSLWDLAHRRTTMFWTYVIGIAIPSTIILALQYLWTYGSAAGGGIAFMPFALVTPEYVRHMPLSLAFPIAVTCFMWRAAFASRRYVLTLAMLVLGFLYVCLLAEIGPRMMDGNFGWTAQTVLFLMYVESLLLAVQAQGWKRYVLGAVFLVHVAFGAIFAAANAFFPSERWA